MKGSAPFSEAPATPSQEPAGPLLTRKRGYHLPRLLLAQKSARRVGKKAWQPVPLFRGTHTHTVQLINKNLIITSFSKANVTEF